MDFWLGLLIYWVTSFFTHSVHMYLFYKILGRKINWKKLVLISFVYDTIIAPIGFILAINYIFFFRYPYDAIFSGVLNYTVLFISIIALYFFIERDFLKTAIVGCISYSIYAQLFMLTFIILPTTYTLNNALNQMITICLLIIGSYLAGILIRKLRVPSFIERCMERRSYYIPVLLIVLFLSGSSMWIELIGPILFHWQWRVLYSLFSLLFLLATIGIYEYISKRIIYQDTKEIQDTIIKQQQTYIYNLEHMQQDVRNYRHDFKNMISGVYLNAKEGNLQEIEIFMQDMLEDFSTNLDQKINLANQMINIQCMELKSLLMLKINYLQKNNIPFHLEVLYPVKTIHMDKRDINRCIGILLDNAIEEVEKTNGDIDIIITSENEDTIIIISNTIKHKPSISRMNQKGYSTKGEDRGLGLYSYQQIIKQYPYVTSMSMYENERFIQELRIGGSNDA